MRGLFEMTGETFDGSALFNPSLEVQGLFMANRRYAAKAHTEARINGETVRSKAVDRSRAIYQLIIAMRDDLSENSSPADWVRSNAAFAKAVANGTVETLASKGPSQALKDAIARLDVKLGF